MSEQFLGEVRIMGFNFPPKGWAQCNGQTLPINQNQALFSLLGTQYGGNGQTTFALPNLCGRLALHMGAGYDIGQVGGATTHTLTMGEMPAHSHTVSATPNGATTAVPTGNVYAKGLQNSYGSLAAPNVASMSPGVVGNVGGFLPHENMMPYLTLNYCIALQGIFPSRN